MGSNLKKELILEGLDCANCALKIEEKVKNMDGVSLASMNFVTKKLSIETTSPDKIDEIIFNANNIIKALEPDVVVTENHEGEDSHDDSEFNKGEIIRLIIGVVLFGIAVIFHFSFWTEAVLYFISYLLVGGEVVLKAVKNLMRGQLFDENFLMSVATIGAFSIKEFPEGVAVMLFYQIGEFFQHIAVNRSRKSIKALMNIRPDFANLRQGNDIRKVSPEEVEVGETIIVKAGEKVPLDGKVIDGNSMLDTSALTGESVPREVKVGDEVLSGFINKNGLLTIEVSKVFRESTVSKILDLVQNASSKKAPTENFITKFARYYTPIVVFIALALALIPPFILLGATFSAWIYRALIFLVVSCPCALVVSIPLGFFGGIGGASKNGILIKGGNYLEALNDVEIVVFDKTGTLTKGVFKVTQIKGNGSIEEKELLEYAALAESYSNHPIAVSVLKAYGKEVDKNQIEDYEEISGYGIKVSARGKKVLAGNTKMMDMESISYDDVEAAGTVIHIAVDKVYAGCIVISDEIKEDSFKAIEGLRSMGVKKIVMLTGDSKAVGTRIAGELGLDEVYAELLPHEKVERLEMLDKNKSLKGRLVFVGDGINDAPVLARADIGVAMGALGSDAAIEAADVVLMTDEPSKLVNAIRIARKTRMVVWQNIIFAFTVKAMVLLLGAGGLATMWEAVFADVGVALLAVLNAMRVMKVKEI